MTRAIKCIVIVDDDETIIDTLSYNLKRHGYDTSCFQTGQAALAGLAHQSPQLIILDWMLPDLQGPDICKLIRSRGLEVPILMLTGRTAPTDVANGLTSGADDYLAKPFSMIELLARVSALLRRTKVGKKAALLTVGDISLDSEARRVTKLGQVVELSPKEFELLRVLLEHADKALSTEVLLNEVWGADFTGDSKTVAVHMRWLRQKLEFDPKYPQLLETVHRVGYRLNSSAAIGALPPLAGEATR